MASRTPNRGPGSSRRPRPRTPAPPPTGEPPPRTRATGRAAVLALVVLALVISYASSLRAWVDQRGEIAEVEAEIAAARDRVDELEQTKQRWHDDAYLQRMARERFGWVLPGEVGYRVIDEDGETVGDTPQLDASDEESPETDQPDWYDRVWGSLETAGEEPAAEEPQPEPTRPADDVIKQQKKKKHGRQ
jgi:cell division protein FtsB